MCLAGYDLFLVLFWFGLFFVWLAGWLVWFGFVVVFGLVWFVFSYHCAMPGVFLLSLLPKRNAFYPLNLHIKCEREEELMFSLCSS